MPAPFDFSVDSCNTLLRFCQMSVSVKTSLQPERGIIYGTLLLCSAFIRTRATIIFVSRTKTFFKVFLNKFL
ncbi:hypothetical protein L596_015079 [Steinernema carpocapsae]|uniref:Uncharacterized protein n=1 Tax=Steinernema carpocapsae TaxID=34508 RepID=A0A4U5NEG1_STECR|nr:hypothetical protein L596_015079 [Steinernema carpocapsae]